MKLNFLFLCITMISSLVFADDFTKALSMINDDIKKHPEWNFHSFLVSRNGQLTFEKYYKGSDQKWGTDLGVVSFNRETLHDLRSVTKSIVSILIGIAIQEGHIKNVDQPLSDFFPENKFPDKKNTITLRHLLTMTTGLAWDEMSTSYSDPNNDSVRLLEAEDPVAFLLARPLTSAPGESFNYCGGSTEVLAEVLQRATKTPIRKYFEKKLWLPLGGKINSYEWGGRKNGAPAGEFGLRIRPIDLMKLANLVENKGSFKGKQIIPAQWISEFSKNQVKALPAPLAARFLGYGFQWWLPRLKNAENTNVFAALGNGGQIAMIFPKQKIVFVTTAGLYGKPATIFRGLLEQHVIPVMKTQNTK